MLKKWRAIPIDRSNISKAKESIQKGEEAIELSHLDLGGGFGVDYEGHATLDLENYLQGVIDQFSTMSKIFGEFGNDVQLSTENKDKNNPK